MKKNYGRKLKRQAERRKRHNDRAYPAGSKYEKEGIKKTKKYVDGRQKIGNGMIHRDDYKTLHQIRAGKK